MTSELNPHAGLPFDDDDAAIAAALEDVSIPALMCSLVHITGDPSWIRGEIRPLGSMLNEYQGYLPEESKADVRRRALPAIAAYRDSGCALPPPPSAELVEEMMRFLACGEVPEYARPMFLEDLHLDGSDAGAITWGDQIPDDVRRDAHTIVIGCGEAGLLAGIRLAQAGLPFTIIEKNGGPGGTWWENRYPGARVDVGSHFYCYSFEPADHWTEYFSQHPELRQYFDRVMRKRGIDEFCRFNTEVTAATFDDTTGRWAVEVRNPDGSTETLDARFVISAVGSLNRPKMPDIPGMDDFAGPSFHSARWDDSVDYHGKRFALIGAGASGFQIAPTIAEDVDTLTIYQRTSQWMFPNFVYRTTVPPGERWALRHLPCYGRWFRFVMGYTGIAGGTAPYVIDPDYTHPEGWGVNESHAVRGDLLAGWIRSQLDDRADLIEKSLPDYPAMGKRILQDDGSWLRNLCRPDVELVRTPIERIVAEGVVTTDGELRPADVICFATGFRHNDFLASMAVTGRDGVDLRAQWGDEPTAYLGITVPNFPNLFCLYGPGTNLAHSASLFFHAEYQTAHALDAIRAVLARDARAIEVDPAVHDAYAERHQEAISQLVWAHPAITHSHYKNPDGRVFTLSPWSIDHYWELTRTLDPADYLVR